LPYLKPHGLAQTKVAHREVYPTNANWKLAVENFRECYHCLPSHPQYSQVNDYVRAGERGSKAYEAMTKQFAVVARSKGRKAGMEHFPLPIQPHQVWRLPIQEGYRTLTRDGSPAGPLLGEFEEYDGAETATFIGALSYLYVTNDHATTFRFTPKSPEFTEVVVSWLVRDDAKEGVDYDLEHLKWMWDVTTIQDTKIINNNQKGVNSSRYSPGPYSEHELTTANFIAWYLWRLSGRTDTECPTKDARFFYERMP
jgi:Rieske 2Fe-2S family protein